MVECGQKMAHILPDKCVGCSACISVCPTKSLAFPERRD
ncbi:4Fe-4S binding protein [Candidatus Saccharibacteria bacterium]|nr:4Fe-4S binding protein [Candidatus Saccharibacteria bacterium]